MRDSETRSSLLRAALVAALLAAPAAIRAADEEPPAEADLVHIEVVVTDRGGDPVSGLDAADFEASIDGLPVRIVALTPPGAPTPTGMPAERQLSLLIYLDSTDIDVKRRSEVLDRLSSSLTDHLGELDRVMVVAGHSGMARPELDLTGDPTLIAETLTRLESSVPMLQQDNELEHLLGEIERMLEPAQNRFDPESERDSQTVAQQLRAYSALRRQRTFATCARLQEAVDLLANMPGRRAIVYIGSGMPLNPGADLLDAVKSARPAIREEGVFASPNNSLPVDLGAGSGPAITALGRYASLHDVAFYSFDISNRTAAMTATSADAGVANAGSTQPGENFNRPAASFGHQADLESSLRIMADETGGLVVRRHQAVDRTLERLIEDREGSYTVALPRPDSAPGSPHAIDIRANRRRLDVRHRRSFLTPDADDLIIERLRIALMGGTTFNPLEASVSSQDAGPLEGNSYDVHLSIRVPVEKLALQPLEQSHKAQVTVFLAASDGNLWTSPIQKVVVPITIPNDEILASMGRSIDYALDMRIFEGREQIALAVHDDIESTLSILTFDAPRPSGEPPGQ